MFFFFKQYLLIKLKILAKICGDLDRKINGLRADSELNRVLNCGESFKNSNFAMPDANSENDTNFFNADEMNKINDVLDAIEKADNSGKIEMPAINETMDIAEKLQSLVSNCVDKSGKSSNVLINGNGEKPVIIKSETVHELIVLNESKTNVNTLDKTSTSNSGKSFSGEHLPIPDIKDESTEIDTLVIESSLTAALPEIVNTLENQTIRNGCKPFSGTHTPFAAVKDELKEIESSQIESNLTVSLPEVVDTSEDTTISNGCRTFAEDHLPLVAVKDELKEIESLQIESNSTVSLPEVTSDTSEDPTTSNGCKTFSGEHTPLTTVKEELKEIDITLMEIDGNTQNINSIILNEKLPENLVELEESESKEKNSTTVSNELVSKAIVTENETHLFDATDSAMEIGECTEDVEVKDGNNVIENDKSLGENNVQIRDPANVPITDEANTSANNESMNIIDLDTDESMVAENDHIIDGVDKSNALAQIRNVADALATDILKINSLPGEKSLECFEKLNETKIAKIIKKLTKEEEPTKSIGIDSEKENSLLEEMIDSPQSNSGSCVGSSSSNQDYEDGESNTDFPSCDDDNSKSNNIAASTSQSLLNLEKIVDGIEPLTGSPVNVLNALKPNTLDEVCATTFANNTASQTNNKHNRDDVTDLEPPTKKKCINSIEDASIQSNDNVTAITSNLTSTDENDVIMLETEILDPFDSIKCSADPVITTDDTKFEDVPTPSTSTEASVSVNLEIDSTEMSSNQEPLTEKPTLPLEFMRKFKKQFDRMTTENLEELVMEKMVEAIVYKSEYAALREKADVQEQLIQTFRTKIQEISKQFRDLEMVHNKIMKDLENKNQNLIAPIKITRAVGLQVCLHKKDALPSSASSLKNALQNVQLLNAAVDAKTTKPILQTLKNQQFVQKQKQLHLQKQQKQQELVKKNQQLQQQRMLEQHKKAINAKTLATRQQQQQQQRKSLPTSTSLSLFR